MNAKAEGLQQGHNGGIYSGESRDDDGSDTTGGHNRGSFNGRRALHTSSATDHNGISIDTQQQIEKPPSHGLRHCYIITANEKRRRDVHKMLSGRADMAVLAYPSKQSFLDGVSDMDQGCIILFGDEQGDVETTVRQLSSTERFLCLVLTSEDDIRLAIEAMKAGAADCLIYPCPDADIQKSVDNTLNQIREHIAEHSEQEEAKRQIERLTSRERDVLFGLMRGKSNKMIAIDLEISPRTVEIYRAHLMEKLGAHSLSDTLKVAFAAGLS